MRVVTPEDVQPKPYWNIADELPRYLSEYAKSKAPVKSTIPELDDMLRGGFRPGVHFIGGNTGAGKSAFCLWLAARIAQSEDTDTGQPTGVTYVSLELGMPEVRARMGSRLSCTVDGLERWSWADFEELGRKQAAAIADGTYAPDRDPVYSSDLELMTRCPNLRIVDAISDGRASDLMCICEEIRSTGAHGGRVLFIDYLQCIDALPGQDETEALRDSVRAVNLAAIRAGVAVIAIAAVSRAKGSEMRKGKSGDNPGADIFRGSSWIEYTGLTAFALVRRDDSVQRGEFADVELWPVKNRRGTIDGPVRLAYNGAYGEFAF